MKCSSCGNEMTEYGFEDYEAMSDEEISEVISEHKEKCEWVEHLKGFRVLYFNSRFGS
ncbi:hypothetical protein LGK95_20055 [Clostridium algoriphilum]|uniref:hypothetical protein n=1 Tax=Clostridium algoriphilum TaxID=198347 RepID=UPI001CF4D019|nr:hypothetical protein [Clostridium algoriphilum]MCB2295772.1 hypothetical protein [Clostridium algoriphilum]